MIFPKSWHNQIKGQAMVETAFVLFVLVLFVFGIIEFGRAMFIKNMLNNAARAGVRCAVVTAPTGLTSPPNWTQANIDTITTCANNSIFYIKPPEQTTVGIFMNNGTTPVAANSVHPTPGDTVTVTVTLTGYNAIVPKLIPISGTFIGTASMRYE